MNGAVRMLFVALGCLALAFAGWQGWRTAAHQHSALRAPGVIAPDSPGSIRTVTAAHPTITFTTRDGRLVRYVQDGIGSMQVGAAVTVFYQPGDPQGTATTGGWMTLWGPVLLPLIMGLGFLGLALSGVELGVSGRH